MKSTFSLVLGIIAITTFFTSTTYAQQEFFPGKYRKLFTLPETVCTEQNCKLTKIIGNHMYVIMGKYNVDEFVVSYFSLENPSKLLMTQYFFMNGFIQDRQPSIGNWFSSKYTLDQFLFDIFQITIK